MPHRAAAAYLAALMSQVFSRKNPFPATVSVNRKLTGEGSNKDTRHFEISLEGSGLKYEVGDSLGVFGSNDPALADLILRRLGFSGEEEVKGPDGQTVRLRDGLVSHFVITEPSKQFLEALAGKVSTAEFLRGLLEPERKRELEAFLWGRDILDLLEEHPQASFSPEEFAAVLRKLQPRLYSIASAQSRVGEAVHLTVAVVRYTPEGKSRPRAGVCSSFLADRSAGPGAVPVFVHSAKHFRMPEDLSAPCVMVGPGTGIAPFRAFLQEREVAGSKGRNWLFFGEQHAATDFFYREEFEEWQRSGLLEKFHTAFSRDQAHKIYVQHRILENAGELFDWLENGAYFYVCGDAQRMAKDVDQALHQVVEKAGGRTPEQAAEYVENLRKTKRYRKDVY
ncbi:MAG: hypothetical protein N2322_01805 [Terrimicrobiaceae bacterium]|nr:hypothetical protein [Terrimicrobiaceae bacterium]